MTDQMPGLSLIQRAMQFRAIGAAGLPAGVLAESDRAAEAGAVPPIEPTLFRSPSSEASFGSRTRPEVAFNAGRCRQDKILLPGESEIQVRNEFRIIKRRLLLALGKNAPEPAQAQVVLVTSARPSEGKTFVSLNLALSLADERDLQILLMEGDVANPSFQRYFGTGRRREGLTDLLNETVADPEDVIHPCEGVANLHVMFAGNPDPRSSELMASPKMPEILTRLHRSFQNLLVVIDCSPIIAPEPAALASHVQHAILVVGAEQSSESELREAIEQVARGCNVSLIFNKSPRWRKKASYYNYGYHYGAAPSGGAQPDLGGG